MGICCMAQEAQQGLCINLESWDGEGDGREFQKGGLYVSLWLIHQRRQWHPTPVLLPGKSHGQRSLVGCSPWGSEELNTTERLHFHALEKEMATHSSVLAWRIPGTREPGGLLSLESHRVRHNWSDLATAAWLIHIEVWQKTTKFCKAIILHWKN